MTQGTILIVDDSLTVRMDLVDAFVAAGFKALPCATLASARDEIARGQVDLAVLDVLLPDGDGIELLKEIRDSPATSATAVLVLSSEAEVASRVRGLRTGADEYVGKPYEPGYVVARAIELLRGRQAAPAGQVPAVLVIDDSETFRAALRLRLEEAGYAVITAATGEEGLRVAAGSRPGAILVDGMLPGIDGAAVIRRVRLDAALRRTPCLLLTASEDRDAELRALDAGADAFLRKDEDATCMLARLAAALRSAAVEPRDEPAHGLLSPKRILAVDDSPTYLEALGAALRDEGYDVILARSGGEAIEMLGAQAVDCILLDVLMPGLSGQETCRRIKSTPIVRDIPLVMLTALDDRAAMIDGLGAGADDYIAKSSELAVLKARVRAQIRRKQFEDENRRIRETLLRKEIETIEARAARDAAEGRAALVGELERKNQELEAFSYMVSHDLRAPLRSIDGFSQALLEDHHAALDAQGQDYLRRVRAAAQRMGELIDDLLELSRVARAELVRETVDLAQVARTVVADLERADPGREAAWRIEAPLVVDADRRLLRIVLENLLGNAWKFTRHAPAARIELGAEAGAGGERIVFVRDNGAGFDARHAAKLFRPFQRLHGEREFPGTGIGLATVHRIVERHGGRVWAEGEPGRGATVRFTVAPAGARSQA